MTQGSFVMVFSGSSVTSGHGNHFNHSYTEVLYRRLNPLFSALGVKLEVRNVAHKYMGCRLMNYCLQTMGGTGFDFVGEDWVEISLNHVIVCHHQLCN